MLKRFNDGLARGEAAIAMAMLLLMIVVAFAQASLRNLTLAGATWANSALAWFDWADFILSKGTLWLAFLGASLAVHADKHIAIDVLPRLVSPRARVFLRALVGIIGAVICLYLARAFWAGVLINGEERPMELEILTAEGSVHVCDATAAQLADAQGSHQGFYCHVRGLFRVLGVRMDTPGAAFQLIVPVMFLLMAVRMFANGLYDFIRFKNNDVDDDASAHGLAAAASDVAHDLDAQKGG